MQGLARQLKAMAALSYTVRAGAKATATGAYLAAHPGASREVARKNAGKFMASSGLRQLFDTLSCDDEAFTPGALLRELRATLADPECPHAVRVRGLTWMLDAATSGEGETEGETEKLARLTMTIRQVEALRNQLEPKVALLAEIGRLLEAPQGKAGGGSGAEEADEEVGEGALGAEEGARGGEEGGGEESAISEKQTAGAEFPMTMPEGARHG